MVRIHIHWFLTWIADPIWCKLSFSCLFFHQVGPKTFASASQTPKESPNANYSPTPSIMNEQSQRMSQNDVVSKTPSFKDSPRSSINTMSMPLTASHSRFSGNLKQ